MSSSKYYKHEAGMKAFGKKLREVRLSRDYSQEQLANECEFPTSQISRIETGAINTSISHIIKIAQVLNISLKELMDFEF